MPILAVALILWGQNQDLRLHDRVEVIFESGASLAGILVVPEGVVGKDYDVSTASVLAIAYGSDGNYTIVGFDRRQVRSLRRLGEPKPEELKKFSEWREKPWKVSGVKGVAVPGAGQDGAKGAEELPEAPKLTPEDEKALAVYESFPESAGWDERRYEVLKQALLPSNRDDPKFYDARRPILDSRGLPKGYLPADPQESEFLSNFGLWEKGRAIAQKIDKWKKLLEKRKAERAQRGEEKTAEPRKISEAEAALLASEAKALNFYRAFPESDGWGEDRYRILEKFLVRTPEGKWEDRRRPILNQYQIVTGYQPALAREADFMDGFSLWKAGQEVAKRLEAAAAPEKKETPEPVETPEASAEEAQALQIYREFPESEGWGEERYKILVENLVQVDRGSGPVWEDKRQPIRNDRGEVVASQRADEKDVRFLENFGRWKKGKELSGAAEGSKEPGVPLEVRSRALAVYARFPESAGWGPAKHAFLQQYIHPDPTDPTKNRYWDTRLPRVNEFGQREGFLPADPEESDFVKNYNLWELGRDLAAGKKK